DGVVLRRRGASAADGGFVGKREAIDHGGVDPVYRRQRLAVRRIFLTRGGAGDATKGAFDLRVDRRRASGRGARQDQAPLGAAAVAQLAVIPLGITAVSGPKSGGSETHVRNVIAHGLVGR